MKTIHTAMIEFGLREGALVGHDNPECRVGEPNRPVWGDGDIVGGVDPLTLIMGHDRLGLVIIIAALANTAPAMLAVNKGAVRLYGIAVHEPRALDEHFNVPIGIPPQQPTVWYI